MSTYRNIVTGEVRNLDPSLVSAWHSASNPKAEQWEPFTPLPEPPPPPPPPDYVGFYSSLLTSTAYQSVLQQSMTSDSPAISTLIAVFISAISEAMAGRPNVAAMQQAVWLLLGNVTLTEADIEELTRLLGEHFLADIYSINPTI